LTHHYGTVNGTEILATVAHRDLDVTALCQAHDRRWEDYAKTPRARQLLAAVAADLELPLEQLIVAIPVAGQGIEEGACRSGQGLVKVLQLASGGTGLARLPAAAFAVQTAATASVAAWGAALRT
jgi:hypothetical protein